MTENEPTRGSPFCLDKVYIGRFKDDYNRCLIQSFFSITLCSSMAYAAVNLQYTNTAPDLSQANTLLSLVLYSGNLRKETIQFFV